MREYRLFTILYHLLANPKTTTLTLARHCEVSQRTILRDLDVMILHNIPIYTKRGKDGGVFLDSRFVIERGLLSDLERRNVRFSLSVIENLLGVNWSTTLAKIAPNISENRNVVSLDLFPWNQEVNDQTRIHRLREAIENKRIVHIAYRRANNIESTRVIHPVQLVYKNYVWYLQAFCTLRQSIRVFKVLRIQSIEVSKLHFDEDYEFSDLVFPTYEQSTKVHLAFHERYLDLIHESFRTARITKGVDRYHAHLLVKEDQWFYAHLLSMGDKIEIVSPPEIRATYLKQLKKIMNLYS